MKIEHLDNIHFPVYFHEFSSIRFITYSFSFLISIYQNTKDKDTNLNKPQNNGSTYIYSRCGQQWPWDCWDSGSIWGLVTDDEHSASCKIWGKCHSENSELAQEILKVYKNHKAPAQISASCLSSHVAFPSAEASRGLARKVENEEENQDWAEVSLCKWEKFGLDHT